MKIRVLTLKYSDGLNGFPEDAIIKATSGHEVLEVRDHFFVHGNMPHIALIITLGSQEARPGKQAKDDPAEKLPDHLKKLYSDIRHWRNERAKSEGIPSYLILRNALIAEICRLLPRSLAALKEIEGIGEATCKKYGSEILAMIPADLKLNEPANDGSFPENTDK